MEPSHGSFWGANPEVTAAASSCDTDQIYKAMQCKTNTLILKLRLECGYRPMGVILCVSQTKLSHIFSHRSVLCFNEHA